MSDAANATVVESSGAGRDQVHIERAGGQTKQGPILRWYYLAALAVALAAVFVTVPSTDLRGVAQLEQIAAKINRARVLSPQAKETFDRLLAQQSALVGLSPADDSRRKAAIERVTAAIKAKASAEDRARLLQSTSARAGH